MQMKRTLSVIVAALILCSSFMLVSSSQSRVSPTAADLWVENNTAQPLASANFKSNIDDVTFFNIAPFGGFSAGVLQFDNVDPVTIFLTFSAPLPGGAVAQIYNNGSHNLVGTININAGAKSGVIRIYPPIGSDAFIVRVYPN
jgi:hypothetical protein